MRQHRRGRFVSWVNQLGAGIETGVSYGLTVLGLGYSMGPPGQSGILHPTALFHHLLKQGRGTALSRP